MTGGKASSQEVTVREDFWPVDTGEHGKLTIGRGKHRVQTCRTVLGAPQLFVNQDCCGIVKSSGDFYCFCLRQAQNCIIDSSCLWDDDAESQKFSQFNAMFSFSFKFNLSNLKFYVLQFLVHLLSFVHLNMFYVVIFIHVSDHGATHLRLCPFNLECKCTSSSAHFSCFLCGITMLDFTFVNLGKALGWHNHNSCWNAVNSRLNVSFISLGFLTYVKFNLRIYSTDETSMTSRGKQRSDVDLNHFKLFLGLCSCFHYSLLLPCGSELGNVLWITCSCVNLLLIWLIWFEMLH